MPAQHIIRGNGHSSTQIMEELNHPWEGASFAHLLPPKFCFHSKGRECVAKQKPSHFQPFFSSPSCPSPRKLVHIDLKIPSSINFQNCVNPQRENRPNPFSYMKKMKTHLKEHTPRSHCNRDRSRTQVSRQLFQVIQSSPFIQDFL